ncbi:MAG: hypothetical protein JSW34_09625, partial [Candidatus Zixiibacteriota bacterium]
MKKLEQVTAEDVKRVAEKYFTDDQKNVLIINTKAGAEEEGGGAEDAQFAQMVQMVNSMTDAAKLEQMIGMVSMQLGQVEDPKQRESIEKLLGVANKKLEELKAAEGN